MERLASPANSFCKHSFPVPGGPINNAPLGILPPRLVYFLGFLRKSTISITSVLASSSPATSLKFNFTLYPLSNIWARDLPTLKRFLQPRLLRRLTYVSSSKSRIAINRHQGNNSHESISLNQFLRV